MSIITTFAWLIAVICFIVRQMNKAERLEKAEKEAKKREKIREMLEAMIRGKEDATFKKLNEINKYIAELQTNKNG